MPSIQTSLPPKEGIWRVARGARQVGIDPLGLGDPVPPERAVDLKGDPAIGHRFDSALGDYRVWYFATTLDGCYGEALAPLRPSAVVRAEVENDGDEGLMRLGEIPADWRRHRLRVRVTLPEKRPFLDVESSATRAILDSELGWLLASLGLDGIDVAAIRSRDRRLTRWISQWTWHQRWDSSAPDYAGIRFCSRIDSDWECWAIFEEVVLEMQERGPVLLQDDALRQVAELYGLDLF